MLVLLGKHGDPGDWVKWPACAAESSKWMPYWIYATVSASSKFPTYPEPDMCQQRLRRNCTLLQPILETDRVSREEVVELCCRKTHQVKPKTIYSNEDDTLCNIFAIHAGQNPAFMRTWLKLYVDMYKQQFKQVGNEYLKSKGLDFDLWRDSIKDSRKGDVVVLLGLNYLMGMHTIGGSWGGCHPNRIHFFRFRICFCQKVYASEVGTHPMGRRPPNRKSWIRHCIQQYI